MWPGAASRSLNYPHPAEMGMLGLRDLFVVAPASSFHHHHHNDVGVIPLLTAAPCLAGVDADNHNAAVANHNRTRGGGIQLWQDYNIKKHHQGLVEQHTSASSDNNLPHGSSVAGAGGITCQDCGNQAKKDCSHRRCRTCCKSRGFDCPTHVKSTWVPAARRRERQLMASAAAATGGSTGSTSGTKKPRLIASQTTTTSHTSTSNTTPARSFDTTSNHQDASFKESMPRQIRAQAVFKCVRVTGVEESEDEYAYQAVVKIGGHVFKGFLYDQGLHNTNTYPNLSDLHLGNTNGATSSSHQMVDPSDVYAAAAAAAGGAGFLPPSTYNANPIN